MITLFESKVRYSYRTTFLPDIQLLFYLERRRNNLIHEECKMSKNCRI